MSTIKTNKLQTIDGTTYNVPVQVVTVSLGTNLGNTSTSTSDQTNNSPSWALSSSTTTWTDTSNLQLSITPKFSSSLIKLELFVFLGANSGQSPPGIRIRRGTTIVFRPNLNATGPFSLGYTGTTTNTFFHYNIVAYDSPATTDLTTYTLQYRTYSGTSCDFFARAGANLSGDYPMANYFVATEIAQ